MGLPNLYRYKKRSNKQNSKVFFFLNMNSENLFQENLKEKTSDLIYFNFSKENLENDCEDIPIDENTVEEIKTDKKSEDSSATKETENNSQRKI